MTNRRKEKAERFGKPKPHVDGRKTFVSFEDATFRKFASDLQKRTIPLNQVTLTDPETENLRAIIRNNGLITFHVQYRLPDSRPYLKIGDWPEMPIKDARKVAKTIHALAKRGIDVQDGLHKRLIRELIEQGEGWRP